MVNREMTRIQHITYAAMKYYAAVEALDPIASYSIRSSPEFVLLGCVHGFLYVGDECGHVSHA